MIRRPPRSTRTDTLFPYTTLFRSPHVIRKSTGLPDPSRPGFAGQMGRAILRRRAGVIAKPPEYGKPAADARSEEHTSELQSLMRISYAVFCLKKKKKTKKTNRIIHKRIEKQHK